MSACCPNIAELDVRPGDEPATYNLDIALRARATQWEPWQDCTVYLANIRFCPWCGGGIAPREIAAVLEG